MSFINGELQIMITFLNDDPKSISETLENLKYSQVRVVLDTKCSKYQEILIQVNTFLIV